MKRLLFLLVFCFAIQGVAAQDNMSPLVTWLRLHTLDGWEVPAVITSLCSPVDGCTPPVSRDIPLVATTETLRINDEIRLTLDDDANVNAMLQLRLLDDEEVVAEESFGAGDDLTWAIDVPAGDYTLAIEIYPEAMDGHWIAEYQVRVVDEDELENFFPKPPPLLLNTADEWIEALRGTSCFPPDEELMGCVQIAALPMPEDYFALPPNNEAHLFFGAQPYPERIAIDLFSREPGEDRITVRDEFELDEGTTDFTWTPDVVAGDYVLHIFLQWSTDSFADYVFGVTIAEPVANPIPQFSLWTADNTIVGGAQGSYCWVDEMGSICRDFMFEIPDVYHPLLEGNVIYIVLQSNDFPDHVYASLYTRAMESVQSSVEMQAPEPGVFTYAAEDVPTGDYVLMVSGVWEDVGDAANIFGVHIEN